MTVVPFVESSCITVWIVSSFCNHQLTTLIIRYEEKISYLKSRKIYLIHKYFCLTWKKITRKIACTGFLQDFNTLLCGSSGIFLQFPRADWLGSMVDTGIDKICHTQTHTHFVWTRLPNSFLGLQSPVWDCCVLASCWMIHDIPVCIYLYVYI